MSDSHEQTRSKEAVSRPYDITRDHQSRAGYSVLNLVLHYFCVDCMCVDSHIKGESENKRFWMQKHASSLQRLQNLGCFKKLEMGRAAHSVGSLLRVEACYVPLVVTAQNKIYPLWESVGSDLRPCS
jgi:hypothetical protein